MGHSLLHPMSPEEIEAEATRQVMAQFAPLFQSLNREFRQGRRAITGSTRGAQRRARSMIRPTQAFFGELVREQAATEDALANYVSGMGDGGLTAALQAIGAPQGTMASVAGGARQSARGAAAASLGTGAGDVGAMRQIAGAEVGLARRMPGIAGLAGQDAIAKLTQAIADQRADLRGQIPGAVSDAVSGLRGQNIDLALANRARRDEMRGAQAGGLEPSQIAGARSDAIGSILALGQSLVNEEPIVIGKRNGKTVYAKQGGGRTFNVNEADTTSKPIDYQDAYQRAYALVAGNLRALGFGETEIRATVSDALAAMGFGGRFVDTTAYGTTPAMQQYSRVEELRARR